MKDQIGSKIKDLRKQQNLTQEQLAERLNVSPQAVSKWENGSNLPDITVLPELADCFGVTIDEIMGHTTNNTVRLCNMIESEEYRSATDDGKRQLLWQFREKVPNDTAVAFRIARYLLYGGLNIDEVNKSHFMEVLCDCVLKNSDDSDERMIAIEHMLQVCSPEKAKKYWKYIPSFYKFTKNEMYEQAYCKKGDYEACRLQQYKNNVDRINLFIKQATRDMWDTPRNILWYKEVIKIIEHLGEDGICPLGWIDHYFMAHLHIASDHMVLGNTEEGYSWLDRALDIYEENILTIKYGDILPMGKEVFFGKLTRTTYDIKSKDGDIGLRYTEDNGLYFEHMRIHTISGTGSVIFYLTDWGGFKELLNTPEYQKRLERVKAFSGGVIS